MSVFVYSIGAVLDIDGGRRISNLDGLSDNDTISALLNLYRQESGPGSLPLYLQNSLNLCGA